MEMAISSFTQANPNPVNATVLLSLINFAASAAVITFVISVPSCLFARSFTFICKKKAQSYSELFQF